MAVQLNTTIIDQTNSREEEEEEEEEEVIIKLKSQIASLKSKVKELEAENAKLSSTLANCRCNQAEEKLNVSTGEHNIKNIKKKTIEKNSGHATTIMNHHLKRYVALKVMYFGQRFYGFSSEGQMDPTVESEIFKALERTRLLIGDKKEIQYSRCGRTDKGVSAVGQVIALLLRSKVKDIDEIGKVFGETASQKHSEGEIDYVRVLNRVLPNDIRIIGWCPVPNDFSARFSCLSREYKYFFRGDNLNLLAMESAGKKFIGEHDFRNFCKMDAMNVHNYRRNITSFEISPCHERYEGNQLFAIKIRGSAFLWHQVRCMVAVLFMIGQGLESPDVIDVLLDTVRTPRKPQYPMAPEIPLVLHSCDFEGLQFTCSTDAGKALRTHLENECRLYQLQAAIFHEAIFSCLPLSNGRSLSNNGTCEKKASHVPLMLRPTERKSKY
ncbi:pseudouridylate synthase, putative [Ricinus communis]|uniref:Pseudouridylate synthase, putative n=1 Tax=Ricinus communis TaxID=3988 RepID=B9SM90_RICCO|nr:pseudouridylate synthase, putative [Ricinus communis]